MNDPLETELARTWTATEKVQAILANKHLWESLQVAALDLADATDDLNDDLRHAEVALRNHRVRPGWVPLDDGHALIWTGQEFLYDDGKQSRSLVKHGVSRYRRLLAVSALPALATELSRVH